MARSRQRQLLLNVTTVSATISSFFLFYFPLLLLSLSRPFAPVRPNDFIIFSDKNINCRESFSRHHCAVCCMCSSWTRPVILERHSSPTFLGSPSMPHNWMRAAILLELKLPSFVRVLYRIDSLLFGHAYSSSIARCTLLLNHFGALAWEPQKACIGRHGVKLSIVNNKSIFCFNWSA